MPRVVTRNKKQVPDSATKMDAGKKLKRVDALQQRKIKERNNAF